MHRFFLLSLTIATLFSCHDAPQPSETLIESELELVANKSRSSFIDIKSEAIKYPERYTKEHEHAVTIHKAITVMDSLLEEGLKNQFEEEFLSLKQAINKSKLYRGSWIFDLMKNRFQYLAEPDFSQPQLIRWHLFHLEEELLNYLHYSLNDNYTILTDIRPVVFNDSAICLISYDTNTFQDIHIWDLSKSYKLNFDNPEDSSIQNVQLKNGRGIVKDMTQFPNGFQGYFKVANKRGDQNHYWFSSERSLDSLR